MADILDTSRGQATRVPDGARAAAATPKTPRKKPRQERSQALVDSILTAASRVLTAVGVERATTSRIAERAGVSIGSLYQYFRDKDDLLGALVERRLEDNMRRFEVQLADGARGVAFIEQVVRAGLATYLDERPFYATVLAHAPFASQRPLVVFLRRRSARVLARTLRERASELAPVDPDVAAFVLLNAFMGVALMAVEDPDAAPDRAALERELVAMFSRYLVKRGA